MRKLHSDEEKGLFKQYHSINIEKLHSLLYNTLVMPLFDYCRLSATVVGLGAKPIYLDKLNRLATCIIEGRSIGAEELKLTLGWPSTSTQKFSQMRLSP